MKASTSVALQVASLRKSYGDVKAVDGVSFEVERGSVFGVIGPNGAGKTTTIECLEGLRRPDSGSVRVADFDPMANRDRVVHKIGVQLQDVGIPPRMKTREALKLFATLYEASISLSELTVELGLEECLSKSYDALSGGQKRRVNIALALVGKPEILFLDEPTTGLDPESRLRFWDYIRRQNALGMTVVVSTHYLEEAQEYCDVVMLMSDGRVLVYGPPDQIVADSGLSMRVMLSRSIGEAVGDDNLKALPGVAHIRKTETLYYVYGDENVVTDVTKCLSDRRISPGFLETRPVDLNDLYFFAVGKEYPEGGRN